MEKLHPDKLLGTALLIMGLIVIIFPAVSVYRVFNGVAKPYDLFSFPSVAIDVGKVINPNLSGDVFKQEIIEGDMINIPMNFIAHVVLMGFIATIGYKIASLGVMLVRTINVQVKEGVNNVNRSTF